MTEQCNSSLSFTMRQLFGRPYWVSAPYIQVPEGLLYQIQFYRGRGDYHDFQLIIIGSNPVIYWL